MRLYLRKTTSKSVLQAGNADHSRAHERCNTALHCVLEWPEVKFVHRAIVKVGRDRSNLGAILGVAWVSLSLLLVGDVICLVSMNRRVKG